MNYSIYVIKNIINNKTYIGRTYKNVSLRFKEHLTSIHRKVAGCRHLVNAIKKYGKHSFYVDFLCCSENEETSFDLEKLFIRLFDSINNGYNLLDGGKQYKHTNETKKLISEKMKGKNSGEHNPFYGKTHNLESLFKISNSQLGHPGYALGKKIHTENSKQTIREAHLGSKNFNTSLKEEDVVYIKTHMGNGGKQIDMVKKYQVSKTSILNIVNGRTWGHVKI